MMRQFLDFEHWHEMKDDLIRSIARLPENVGKPLEAGEKLKVDFKGMVTQVTVLVRSSDIPLFGVGFFLSISYGMRLVA